MGSSCGGQDKSSPEKAKDAEEPGQHSGAVGALGELVPMHLDGFTPTNLSHHARCWLELLALPLPVAISLLIGGFLGGHLGHQRFLILVVVFFAITPRVYKFAMGKLGVKLKEYLELVDREYLGVDLHIGELDLCVCQARIVLDKFRIDNPPGYKGDYLLDCKNVTLDIDLLELLLSKGKKVVVEEFKLEGIDVILEYDTIVVGVGKSNVNWIMDFMHNRGKKEGEDADKKKAGDDKTKANEKPTEPKKDDKTGKEEKKPGGREKIIQKVSILDLGAKVKSSIGVGPRIALADIRYPHFTEQFKVQGVVDVIEIIMKSLAKSIIANVAGKAMADKSM